MNVGKICRRPAITVQSGDSLTAVARRMRDEHVGYLVVVNHVPAGFGERALGVLTDRDIVTAVLARDLDPRNLTAADIMNSPPVTVGEADSLKSALQTMHRSGVRRVPVLNGHGELVGVLSLDDVIDGLASEIQEVAGAIRNGQRIEGVLRS